MWGKSGEVVRKARAPTHLTESKIAQAASELDNVEKHRNEDMRQYSYRGRPVCHAHQKQLQKIQETRDTLKEIVKNMKNDQNRTREELMAGMKAIALTDGTGALPQRGFMLSEDTRVPCGMVSKLADAHRVVPVQHHGAASTSKSEASDVGGVVGAKCSSVAAAAVQIDFACTRDPAAVCREVLLCVYIVCSHDACAVY